MRWFIFVLAIPAAAGGILAAKGILLDNPLFWAIDIPVVIASVSINSLLKIYYCKKT